MSGLHIHSKITAAGIIAYDALGRPIDVARPYDQSGNLEREEDPLGKVLLYTWYPSGQLKQKIDAQSGQILVAYTYLPDGKLATKTVRDAAGVNQSSLKNANSAH